MALKAFIKDLSEVEQAEQALYKKHSSGEGYVVDVESTNGYNLENISGLTSTLEKQKREIEQANGLLKQFGDLKPEDVLSKLKRYDAIKDLNPEQLAKQAESGAKEKIRAEFEGKIKELTETINSRNEAIKKAEIGKVLSSIKEAGGVPELAESYIQKVCRVEIADDGTPSMKIFHDDGETPRINTNDGDVVPFTSSDLVKDLQQHEIFGKIFASKAKSGNGDPNYKPANNGEIKTITTEQAESGQFNQEIAAGKVNVA